MVIYYIYICCFNDLKVMKILISNNNKIKLLNYYIRQVIKKAVKKNMNEKYLKI
jgi:hypothetical protein